MRFRAARLLLLLLLLLAPCGLAGAARRADDDPSGLSGLRDELVARMNAARAEQGLAPGALHAALTPLAQARAAALSAAADPDRAQRPRNLDSATREDGAAAAARGYEAASLAEVVVRADGDAETVLEDARADSGFEEELLREGRLDLGIGIANPDEAPLYVFLFARSRAAVFEDAARRLADLAAVRRTILARVNRERVAAHLSLVRESPGLDAAALRHARDMLDRSYYGHHSPEGSTAFERTRDVGYRALFVGENIARGPESGDAVMDGWMSSPEHREHILATRFTETGSAVATGHNRNGDQILWVQLFGRPKSSGTNRSSAGRLSISARPAVTRSGS